MVALVLVLENSNLGGKSFSGVEEEFDFWVVGVL
jgi:hypothetical protein